MSLKPPVAPPQDPARDPSLDPKITLFGNASIPQKGNLNGVWGSLPPSAAGSSITPNTTGVEACVRVPGSKSLTQRGLIMGALGRGWTTLKGALMSEDTLILSQALRALGFEVRQDGDSLGVLGMGGDIPNKKAQLFLGNAGTAARFLTPFVCLSDGGRYHLEGSEVLHTRPMAGLLQALEACGAARVEFLKKPGHLPCILHTRGLRPGTWTMTRDPSSQGVSGLLMAASRVDGPVELKLQGPALSQSFEAMSCQLLQGPWGALDITPTSEGYRLKPQDWTGPRTYRIEADASSASYALALCVAADSMITHRVEVQGAYPSPLQGDWGFLDILKKMGVEVSLSATGTHASVPAGAKLSGVFWDFCQSPDIFMTLAALAPLLEGPTQITGIAHTRLKECNRPEATAQALQALGQHVELTHDTLTIHPRPLRPACIQTHNDHRIAMSFAVLGRYPLLGDTPWLSLDTPGACAKSFPDFFQTLFEKP